MGLRPHYSCWLWFPPPFFPSLYIHTTRAHHSFAEWILHLCIVMPLLMPLNNPSPALGAAERHPPSAPSPLTLTPEEQRRSDSKKPSVGRVGRDRIQIRPALLLLIFVLGEERRRIDYQLLTLPTFGWGVWRPDSRQETLGHVLVSLHGHFVLICTSLDNLCVFNELTVPAIVWSCHATSLYACSVTEMHLISTFFLFENFLCPSGLSW